MGKQVMSRRIAHNVGKLAALARGAESECLILTVGGTAGKETGVQQGQGSRGQGQIQSGASSAAAGSSSSSGVQSTVRGISGRGHRG
ncbi:unnamed protein product [Prunus armeniaca]